MNSILRWVVVGLSLIACWGCGPQFGQVSGVVKFQNQPLPGGTVTFRPADSAQNSVAAILERDGQFRVTLPVGDVVVCVDNREFEPQPATVGPNFGALSLSPEATKQIQAAASKNAKDEVKKSDRYVKIPEKFYTVEKSGLTITVKKGEQSMDIELKE